MAAKKSSKGKSTSTRSVADFVRTLPNVAVDEVISQAKAAGYDSITKGYVYSIRSKAKKAGAKAPRNASTPGSAPKPKGGGRAESVRSKGDVTHQLVALLQQMIAEEVTRVLKEKLGR